MVINFMTRIMRSIFMIIFALVLVFCCSESYASTNDDGINSVVINKEYSVSEFKRNYDDYDTGYYKVKYDVPRDGKVKINILDCDPDGLYDYYNISDGHLRNPSGLEAEWIEYVDWMTTGWFSVEEGEQIFCFDKMGYGNAANYLGVFTIEYTAADDYSGEIENNDKFENANEIISGDTYEGNYSHDVYEGMDIDCYKFSLQNNSSIIVSLKELLKGGGVSELTADIYMTDENGNKEKVYSVDNCPDTEINKLRLPKGEYYLEVRVSPYHTREYSLRIDITDELGLNVEQEFNNFSRTANTINSNTEYTGNLNSVDDIDWYKISVPVQSELSASFWIPEQLGNDLINIAVYDEQLELLVETNTTNDKYLETSVIPVDIGNYYIRIKNLGDFSNLHDYNIRINVKCLLHNYGEWIIDKEATCTETGSKHRDCICGDRVTETIAALGHDVKVGVAVAATCTTTGLTEESNCSRCDYKVEQEIIPALGHTWAEDYTIETPATTKANGSKSYHCTVCNVIDKTSITVIPKIKSITLSATEFIYNNKEKEPTVKVKDVEGRILKKGNDYGVEHATGRKNVGTYKVTIIFKGSYSGSKTLSFKIIPKSTVISSLTRSTKAFTVKWKKQSTQTTGYQILYSTSSKFNSGNKYVTVTSNKTTAKKITKLKAKKKYYVKVRTYKTVNGTKYYSN